MNRAILIVICDFLVSAMLTMMTGMVPGHTGGTGVGLDESTTKVLLNELGRRQQELETLRARLRETVARGADPESAAQLKKLTVELAENLSRQSRLRAALAATPENTGRLDADKLRKQLDEEQLRRRVLEIELKDASGDLKDRESRLLRTGEQLRTREREYAVQNRELSRTREALADTTKALVDSSARNAEVRGELTRSETRRAAAEADAANAKAQLSAAKEDLTRTTGELNEERKRSAETGTELARRETELRERRRELQLAKDSLRTLNAAHTRTEGQLGALQIRFAETSGRLATREQDNASLRDDLTRISRDYHVATLARKEAETKTQMMQETLKDTVRELAASRQELNISKQTNARLDATVETMKKMAVTTVEPAKTAVFEKYAGAVVRLECSVSEKAFIGTRTGSLTSFYPLVEYDGRTMIVGALNRFAGDWDKVLDFKEVILVEMAFSPPFGNSAQIRRILGGPMLASSSMPHLAAFPCEDRNSRPLTVIDAAKLRERGAENLYLFKCSSFESNSRLDGRVSLVMDAENPSLFIRNAGRSNNELTAEPGDLILTAAGELVGVVSIRESVDRVEGARVPLFRAGRSVWEGAVVVPLGKSGGEEHYSRFGKQMQLIRTKFEAGYRRR